MNRREAAELIVRYYGKQKQEVQAIQELLELSLLLTKRDDQRGDSYKFCLIDEIADSLIMIEQIKAMHDLDDSLILKRIRQKLNRQFFRIESEERMKENET